jgi:RNA polymerase sigma factor (sigma-70 family)
MTDIDIITHLKHNKYAGAVKGLYTVFPAVKKHIRSNNGNSEDAEDIFQDALVVLYKKVHTDTFALSVPLKTFLFAIVKNLWLQELRRRQKAKLIPSADTPVAPGESGETYFSTAEAAFSLLGEKCRQLLVLFYYKQQSFKQIAAALSFGDEKTAKNQKYRCLQKAKDNYSTLSKNNSHE